MHQDLRIRLASFVALLLVHLACLAQDPTLRLTVLVPEPPGRWEPAASLAVQVEVLHPADLDDAAPGRALSIGAAATAWPAAVSLVVTGPDGKPVEWPFARSGTRTPGPLRLTVGGSPAMGFLLPAAEQRRAMPGRYTLRAVLEVRDGDGWRGRVESAPLALDVGPADGGSADVGPAVGAPRSLGVSLVGAGTMAPGDPWVFAIELPPPLSGVREEALRSAYTLRLMDAAGNALPVAFAPIAAPPALPEMRQLATSGFGPVLAVLPPQATKDLAPGAYELAVGWRASATATPLAGALPFTVIAAAAAAALADRPASQQRARLAHATALLWHAEFGNAEHLERVTTEAAGVLLAAEQAALVDYAARPTEVRAAAALAEAFALQGDFDGALAFAQVAQGLWQPPAPNPDEPPAPPPEDLRNLVRDIEARARQGHHRVLPYLRTAMAAARGAGPVANAATPAAPSPADQAPAPDGGLAQWATTARASSEYRATDYSAAQATGEPNVAIAGDSPRAWASKQADAGEEWLELGYAQPVRATAVRVVQSFQPGAILRIDVVDAAGQRRTVWTGPDATAYAKAAIGVLEAKFAATTEPVRKVVVVLDTRAVPGWNEIDAVQLVGSR